MTTPRTPLKMASSGVYLFVGEHDDVHQSCKQFIAKNIGKTALCVCEPEKGVYKKADLEMIRNMLRFTGDTSEPTCIILTHAHKLSELLVASFLKLLEELPEFCYVCILVPSKHLLPATLASRCIHIDTTLTQLDQRVDQHAILQALFNGKTQTYSFEELLKIQLPDEPATRLLADKVIAALLYDGHAELAKKIQKNSSLVGTGNSVLFWKSTFLLMRE